MHIELSTCIWNLGQKEFPNCAEKTQPLTACRAGVGHITMFLLLRVHSWWVNIYIALRCQAHSMVILSLNRAATEQFRLKLPKIDYYDISVPKTHSLSAADHRSRCSTNNYSLNLVHASYLLSMLVINPKTNSWRKANEMKWMLLYFSSCCWRALHLQQEDSAPTMVQFSKADECLILCHLAECWQSWHSAPNLWGQWTAASPITQLSDESVGTASASFRKLYTNLQNWWASAFLTTQLIGKTDRRSKAGLRELHLVNFSSWLLPCLPVSWAVRKVAEPVLISESCTLRLITACTVSLTTQLINWRGG